MDGSPIIVAKHLSSVKSILYSFGIRFVENGNLSPWDFVVSSRGGVKVHVVWIDKDLLPSVKQRVKACEGERERNKDTVLFLVCRSPATLDEFNHAQSFLLQTGFPCMAVGEDPHSVCITLKHLQMRSPTKKVTADADQCIINTCKVIPRVGDQICQDKLLPSCRNVRGIAAAAAKHDLDIAVGSSVASSIYQFFSTRIED